MLEEQVRRFKVGYRICDGMVYDVTHPDNPKQNPKIHQTRVNGINEQTDSWEGLGYLTSVALNCVKHPKTMYKLLYSQKD